MSPFFAKCLNLVVYTQQNCGEWGVGSGGDEGDEGVGEDQDNYHNF
ncbi:hypothetical protein GXM_00164 [Nostoc sphaeroides CCNUC1]|uniref:Uncharacterized protein n=1 Tax=Nostoc sphaeroides CCNUC1 TaxID=2653204 RepID=A0A5P8VQY8_9NOSO|nr:hypothetical protein GXM_00164 [Nostoc sphaeroides CCNUC1]